MITLALALWGCTSEVEVELLGGGAGRVTSEPAGIDCPGACAAPAGPARVLRAEAAPNHRFQGWGGACLGDGPCALPPGQAAKVQAVFQPTYPLALSFEGDGLGRVNAGTHLDCASDCVARVPAGWGVELSAQPAPGMAFAGWGGACAGSGPCVLSMAGPQRVSARFEALAGALLGHQRVPYADLPVADALVGLPGGGWALSEAGAWRAWRGDGRPLSAPPDPTAPVASLDAPRTYARLDASTIGRATDGGPVEPWVSLPGVALASVSAAPDGGVWAAGSFRSSAIPPIFEAAGLQPPRRACGDEVGVVAELDASGALRAVRYLGDGLVGVLPSAERVVVAGVFRGEFVDRGRVISAGSGRIDSCIADCERACAESGAQCAGCRELCDARAASSGLPLCAAGPEAFVAAFSPAGEPLWFHTWPAAQPEVAVGLGLDSAGHVVAAAWEPARPGEPALLHLGRWK